MERFVWRGSTRAPITHTHESGYLQFSLHSVFTLLRTVGVAMRQSAVVIAQLSCVLCLHPFQDRQGSSSPGISEDLAGHYNGDGIVDDLTDHYGGASGGWSMHTPERRRRRDEEDPFRGTELDSLLPDGRTNAKATGFRDDDGVNWVAPRLRVMTGEGKGCVCTGRGGGYSPMSTNFAIYVAICVFRSSSADLSSAALFAMPRGVPSTVWLRWLCHLPCGVLFRGV